MLALTRRRDERVQVGSNVVVTVRSTDTGPPRRVVFLTDQAGDVTERQAEEGQFVQITSDTRMKVIRIRAASVILGFDAPRQVRISRLDAAASEAASDQ